MTLDEIYPVLWVIGVDTGSRYVRDVSDIATSALSKGAKHATIRWLVPMLRDVADYAVGTGEHDISESLRRVAEALSEEL